MIWHLKYWLMRWASQWLALLDSLVGVLTLGIYNPGLKWYPLRWLVLNFRTIK